MPRPRRQRLARGRDGKLDGGFGAPHTRRQPGEPARIESFFGELRQQHPQPGTSEARIAVARIFAVRHAGTPQRGDQPSLGHAEQGPDEKNCPLVADRYRQCVGHTGKSGQPAAACQSKQHRFCLIVERMRGQNVLAAGARRRLRQQSIARVARSLL